MGRERGGHVQVGEGRHAQGGRLVEDGDDGPALANADNEIESEDLAGVHGFGLDLPHPPLHPGVPHVKIPGE
ncbi:MULTISPECIES: hypothetical protein [Auritidibacter]|uniref:hypothetical protein n=1 Tax=Auritidibacter TaxID=1160973 RepID=UPI0011E5B728|nr:MULTISPECIES: hypothetical protein [Auritidibacter]WGH84229.1 hypothetical protein QDX20_01410 [Auritidibacter ignavus]